MESLAHPHTPDRPTYPTELWFHPTESAVLLAVFLAVIFSIHGEEGE